MIDSEIKSLIKELATELYHIPPVEWNRIVFCAEMNEVMPTFWYYFFPTMDNDPRQSDSLYKEFGFSKEKESSYDDGVIEILWKVINLLFSKGESPWNTLTVIIEHTGDFNFDLELQDFSSSDSMERREIWEEKYLVDPPLKQAMDPQKRIDDLISNLGQNLVNIMHYNRIPVDWDRIEFYAEVSKGSASIHYLYYPKSDKQPREMENLLEENGVHHRAVLRYKDKLARVVGYLHDAFTDAGQEPWTTITASINEDGTFDVDFGYDELSAFSFFDVTL